VAMVGAVVGALEAAVAKAGIVTALAAGFLVAAMLAAIITTIIAAFVASLFVAPVLVAWLRLGVLARVARKCRHGGLLAHSRIGGLVLAILARLAHVIDVAGAMAVAVDPFAALLHLLLAVGDDHAVVVFGVLEIVLAEDRIAGGLRVPGEGDVL